MVGKLLLALGVLLSAVSVCFVFLMAAVARHYHPDNGYVLLLFGSIGALPTAAIAIQLHIYLAWQRGRQANGRVVLGGFVVGAVMAAGGLLLLLRDGGDYFFYLPFALAGVILLWACRASSPKRPLRQAEDDHSPSEGEWDGGV